MERMAELFTDGKGKQMKEKNLLIGKLTKEIGQLKVELDSSQKKLDLPVRERTLLIERDNRKIPVARQAELLGTFRSTVYYKPVVDEYNLKLMHLIDESIPEHL